MPRYAYVSRVLCLRIIDTSHMDTNIGSILPRKRQHRDISTPCTWVCEKNKTTNYLYCIFGQMPRYAYVSRVLCLRIIGTSHMDTNIGSILPRKRQHRDISTQKAWVCEKNKTTNYLYCIFEQMPRYAYVSRVLYLRIIGTSHMDTNIGSICHGKDSTGISRPHMHGYVRKTKQQTINIAYSDKCPGMPTYPESFVKG